MTRGRKAGSRRSRPRARPAHPGRRSRFARCGAISFASSRAAPNAAAARSHPRARAERRHVALDKAGIETARRGTPRRGRARASNARLVRGPATIVRSSAARKLIERGLARRRVRDHLGDHRIVVRRDLAALASTPVSTRTPSLGKLQRDQRAGRRQEAARRDLRHRAAPRPHGPAAAPAACASGSFSPAAMRNCHSTRSSPVIASVTGCSTCSRVFISMNQKPSARSPFAPSAMNSTVPAPA